MKHIAILALVATLVLTGCNKKQDTPLATSDALVDQRPAGRTTATDEQPVVDTSVTQLSDAEIDSIVGTPTDSSASVVTVDTTTSTVRASDTSVSGVRPAPEVGLTHTIRKGETLWSLATKYLGHGRRWTEIVDANPGLQPKRLPIGKTIRIPQ